jgi:hypothetical protein
MRSEYLFRESTRLLSVFSSAFTLVPLIDRLVFAGLYRLVPLMCRI